MEVLRFLIHNARETAGKTVGGDPALRIRLHAVVLRVVFSTLQVDTATTTAIFLKGTSRPPYFAEWRDAIAAHEYEEAEEGNRSAYTVDTMTADFERGAPFFRSRILVMRTDGLHATLLIALVALQQINSLLEHSHIYSSPCCVQI